MEIEQPGGFQFLFTVDLLRIRIFDIFVTIWELKSRSQRRRRLLMHKQMSPMIRDFVALQFSAIDYYFSDLDAYFSRSSDRKTAAPVWEKTRKIVHNLSLKEHKNRKNKN